MNTCWIPRSCLNTFQELIGLCIQDDKHGESRMIVMRLQKPKLELAVSTKWESISKTRMLVSYVCLLWMCKDSPWVYLLDRINFSNFKLELCPCKDTPTEFVFEPILRWMIWVTADGRGFEEETLWKPSKSQKMLCVLCGLIGTLSGTGKKT